MIQTASYPLTQDHLRLIDHHLNELQSLSDFFEKCKQCNLLNPDLKSDTEYLIGQLTAIKQNFFTPGGYVPKTGDCGCSS